MTPSDLMLATGQPAMADKSEHSSSSKMAINAGITRASPPESAAQVSSAIPTLRGQIPAHSPFTSTPESRNGSSSAVSVYQQQKQQKYFHSRRVKKGEIERPWLDKKDPREKWVWIIPMIGMFIGLSLAALLIYDGLRAVINHEYCPVLDEDFSRGFDTNVWTKEAEVGGFGNGQFDETTTTDENVFVRDGKLHIKPSLQEASLIERNSTIDLQKQGTCSSNRWYDCHAVTNTTNGTIVPPVRSGRISTKKGATIRYGRVEVTATLPSGDWLWPAIWMLPVNTTYGPWPRSGEIDIAECRGNNYSYSQGGNNIVSSALHWGPNPANNAWWRTNVKRNALHTTFSKKSHTFGLEWSSKYLFTYIDTRLLQVLYTPFDQPLWRRGQFPLSDANGTRLVDPWSTESHFSAPFDREFYLLLNVAVGGTNGWFEDGKSGKPWVDASPTARLDFWNARGSWFPTWERNGEMIVSRVRMWQEGACVK